MTQTRHSASGYSFVLSSEVSELFDKGQDVDTKLHVPHGASSLRSRFLDPIIMASRQFRFSSVPSSVMLIGCFLAFLAGSYLQTAELLPAPGGPTVSLAWQSPRDLHALTADP